MEIPSKLPKVGTTIFTIMSTLANEHKAINLAQGFPDFPCSEKLQDLVHRYMREGMNQYAPMPGVPVLRQKISAKIAGLYSKSVDPDTEITVTAGATQALFCAITAFVRPGDEVIIIEPAYDSYLPAIELCGGIVVPYPLAAPDYRIDWHVLQRMITPRTRLLITNNPHNPTGKIFSATDLEQLEKLLAGTNILHISDEVYEHLTFDGRRHISVLSYPELYRRSILTFSFGKTYHTTGWKMGYVVAPPALTKEFRKVHQFNVFSVHTPTQYALADFLDDPAEYLYLPDFFQRKRDFFLSKMEGSRLRPITCEGTYFQLFDYSEISEEPDTAFAKRLTVEHGVAAIPVSVFYADGRDERVIRLCFAKKEETLAAAAERLKKV